MRKEDLNFRRFYITNIPKNMESIKKVVAILRANGDVWNETDIENWLAEKCNWLCPLSPEKSSNDYYCYELNKAQQKLCTEITYSDFIKMFGEPELKPKKTYMVYVEGKSSPKVRHSLENAEKEALRLVRKEVDSKVYVVEVVKAYQATVKIEEIDLSSKS